jgi:hypothetical protein
MIISMFGLMRRPAAVRFFAILLVLPLAACAVQLAPSYEQSIVDNLNNANVQTMTLFATISTGVTKDTFPARQQTYNTIIGQFSAVESQVQSRPPAQPGWLGNVIGSQAQKGPLPDAPTKANLDTVISTLTKMRDTDQLQGLPASNNCPTDLRPTGTPLITCLFINAYKTSFDDALTYEMALKR